MFDKAAESYRVYIRLKVFIACMGCSEVWATALFFFGGAFFLSFACCKQHVVLCGLFQRKLACRIRIAWFSRDGCQQGGSAIGA